MRKREYAEAVAKGIENGKVEVVEKYGKNKRYGIVKTNLDISPCIYIDEAYECGRTVEEVIEMTKEMFDAVEIPTVEGLDDIIDTYESAKEKIRLRLLNKDFKADVYETAEGYGFPDLIIVPYIDVTEATGQPASVRVTKELLKRWDVDKMQVMWDAITMVEAKVTNMYGMTIVSAYGVGEQYGAIGILAARQQLREMFPEGYVVIPSSIHEVLVFPRCEEMPIELLKVMVQEVNEGVVAEEDQLSNEVYSFIA